MYNANKNFSSYTYREIELKFQYIFEMVHQSVGAFDIWKKKVRLLL